MPLTATLSASLSGTFSKAETFNDKNIEHSLALSIAQAFANGTGANQANQIYVGERTLADEAQENLDLSGSLADQFGSTIAFTGIKGILIQNQSALSSLLFEPGSTNGFLGPFADASDQVIIPPGGVVLMTNASAAGWPVTASTGDLLSFTHNSEETADLEYKIALIGIV